MNQDEKVEKLRDFVDDWTTNMEFMCIDLLQDYLNGLFGERKK